VFDGWPDEFDGWPDEFDGWPDEFDGWPDEFDGWLDEFDGWPDEFVGWPDEFDGWPNEMDARADEFSGRSADSDGQLGEFNEGRSDHYRVPRKSNDTNAVRRPRRTHAGGIPRGDCVHHTHEGKGIMLSKHRRVQESFQRVHVFVEANPATGQPGFETAKAALVEALTRLREFASVQISGRELSRAELRRRGQMLTRLRDRHMRPIVTIARGQIEPNSDVRLPEALRMPHASVCVTTVLQAADAMIEAASTFESVFVANGLPADFLARFQRARDVVAEVVDARAMLLGASIGARKGIEMQLRRGRLAVDRLDAVVRAAFEGEEAILATWRSAKRVQRRPGGSGPAVSVDSSPDVADAQMEMAKAA
jgi:hypothetical protein